MANAGEALAGWLALVVVTSIVVVWLALRWGRDPFGWLLLSAATGPIALVALIGTRQRDTARPESFERGAPEDADTIVAACDATEASERIARYLAERTPNDRIALLTVLPHEERLPADASEAAREEQRQDVERATKNARAILAQAGVTAHVVVGYGAPGEEIVRYADDANARLIVVGRRGSGLTRALLGSVADYVVRHANRPVLVVE